MADVPLSATALYAGLNALIMLVLAVRVSTRRRAAGISLGAEGDPELRVRVSSLANNTEYVPYALVLIGILELAGQAPWQVHALGAALTAGRVLHPIGLAWSLKANPLRVLGMVLTWGVLGVAALACIRTALAA